MLLNIKGSNKATRTLVNRAAWWYAEKLMGKRLMNALEININLDRTFYKKFNMEGSAIWEDEGRRPREFTIELDATMSIRNILITLAHEMVHVDVPGEHLLSLSPQARVIRNQILMTMRDL